MRAKDVFKIVKVLDMNEQKKLYDLMSNNFMVLGKKMPISARLPEFTIADGIKYLIDNQIKNKDK